jgi:hypothetical protein
MRSHVQTIGQQSHGSKGQAGTDFYSHGRGGDSQDDNGSLFAAALYVLAKAVIVLPGVLSFVIHNSAHPLAAAANLIDKETLSFIADALRLLRYARDDGL